MSAGGTPALRVLAAAGIPYTLHPYEAEAAGSASYGEQAAAALGVEPARLLKSLVAEVDGRLVVAVVPVSGSLDCKALAASCGGKRAAMAAPAAAERATGYVVGGISPLGHRSRLPVLVDSSALTFATVFCSAGRRGLQVELAPADLVRATAAIVAPISRPA